MFLTAQGGVYPLRSMMPLLANDGGPDLVFASAWRCTESTADYANCLDNSAVVLDDDGNVLEECDWRKNSQDMGWTHGGDGWGFVQHVKDRAAAGGSQFMAEVVAVNLAQLRERVQAKHNRRAATLVVCLIDWCRAGFHRLPSASLCLVDPRGKGAGPFGTRIISSLLVDGPGKPLHMCYALDIREPGAETVTLVDQRCKTDSNLIGQNRDGIKDVLDAVFPDRSVQSIAPTMAQLAALYTIGLTVPRYTVGVPPTGTCAGVFAQLSGSFDAGLVQRYGIEALQNVVATLPAAFHPEAKLVLFTADSFMQPIDVSKTLGEALLAASTAPPSMVYLVYLYETETTRARRPVRWPGLSTAPPVLEIRGWRLGNSAREVRDFVLGTET